MGFLSQHRTNQDRKKSVNLRLADLQKGMIVEVIYSPMTSEGKRGKPNNYMFLILNPSYKTPGTLLAKVHALSMDMFSPQTLNKLAEDIFDGLPWIINENPDVEAYWVSRINTVNGLTKEHIRRWGWNVDNKGWVNFPDKQMRIYKNDPDRIKWTRPVHEQLVGYKKYASLPSNEEYCLHHPKDIKRQERQNDFYEKI
jgi:hypothetical protein